MKIADLHCDLLDYLRGDPKRGINDAASRCSLPQLRAGGVAFQGMAMFTRTGDGSVASATMQSRIFSELPQKYPKNFKRLAFAADVRAHLESNDGRIGIVAAIENASGFCDENEPLADGLARLKQFYSESGPFLYCGLTWHTENRFGGGNRSTAGLKEDGKRLVEKLAARRIAIDLSHASDQLAYDLLEFVEAEQFDVPIIASHSNFRAVADVDRNLPDDLAKAIVQRGGIVGFNMVGRFIGSSPQDCLKQWRQAMRLGLQDQLVFGADFYCTDDIEPSPNRPANSIFFTGYDTAACYPQLLQLLSTHADWTPENAAKLSRNNLLAYLERSWVPGH